MASRSLKETILTIPPKRWSIHKVQELSPSAFKYMITKAKQLVMGQDIMSSSNPEPGKTKSPLKLYKVCIRVMKQAENSLV
jgi:hypothetical protein